MNSLCSIAGCDKSATQKTFCKELLKLRARESLSNDLGLLCVLHHKHYIVFNSKRIEQKYCSNPYGSHGSQIKGREITSNYAKENERFDLIPGKKLCVNCRARIKNAEDLPPNTNFINSSVETEPSTENVLDISYTETATASEAHELSLHTFNSAIGKILSNLFIFYIILQNQVF